MPQPTSNLKIRAERAALTDALGWVARALPKNPPVPVLAGVRVSASGGVIRLSAFDYETQHTAAVEATVGDEGECVVSGTFFRDAVAGGRGSEVDLVLADNLLEVSSGRSTYRVRTFSTEDAPTLPTFPEVRGVVSSDRLRDAVQRIAPGIDDDPLFSQTRGVHVEGDADTLTLVATDRFRFHVITVPWNGDSEFNCRIPGRTLVEAVKGMAEDIEVGATENLFGLSDGRHQWTTRLFDSPTMPWRSLVDRYVPQCSHSLAVDRSDLLAAVKQVGAATENERAIEVEFRDGELTVRTPEQEQGEGVEVLPADGSEPMLFAANHRYLAEALAVTDGPIELRHGGIYAKGGAFIIADQAQPDLTLIVMSKTAQGGTR